MSVEATCPRCGALVRAPGLYSSQWRCDQHGDVAPCLVPPHVGPALVSAVRDRAGVPVWLPAPVPDLWALNGVAYAGDDRELTRAVALALSGPSPLGGPVDLVVVAEDLGIGLGAGLAGLEQLDPGREVGTGPPAARVVAGGHDTPLWEVAADPARVALAGEAQGVWIWVLAWAARADLLLIEDLRLADLRPPGGLKTPLENLRYGPVTSRLTRPGLRSGNTG